MMPLAVSNSGRRWILCAVVVRVPSTERQWAPPFLSILASPPVFEAARQLGMMGFDVAALVGGFTARRATQPVEPLGARP